MAHLSAHSQVSYKPSIFAVGDPLYGFSFIHVGAVYNYIIIQLAICVPSHVITLFWGITFPFHYRAFERRGRLKYIHITVVVVALILPTIPVGIALGTGGYIYDGIPPLTCIPKNVAVNFYALSLPTTVLVSTGGTFLVLIAWKLIKVR